MGNSDRNSGLALTAGCILMPRFVRLRDAPAYLGMDRNKFNMEADGIFSFETSPAGIIPMIEKFKSVKISYDKDKKRFEISITEPEGFSFGIDVLTTGGGAQDPVVSGGAEEDSGESEESVE